MWNPTSFNWNCEIAPNLPVEPTPTPTPTEPPTPIAVSCDIGAVCGSVKTSPCWEASNAFSLDTTRPPLWVTDGFAGVLHDLDDTNPGVDVQQGVAFPADGNMQANADQIANCTLPYQFSLIPEGQTFHDFFTGIVDVKGVFDEARLQKTVQERIGWDPTAWLIFGMFSLIMGVFSAVMDQVLRAFGFMSECMMSVVKSDVVFRVANFVCLGGLRKPRRVKDYADNLSCPVGLPTPELAAAGWLGNEIDECTFQAYVKAGDNVYTPYKACVRAGKLKWTPIELMTLFMRGQIQRSDVATRLRELGSLEPQDLPELQALFQQIPGPADLVRFMQRDVEDQNIIGTFGLDTDFAQKYQGQTKIWAGMQGVSDEIMLREWRAHWDIPSPTQLYEMLHRLRHNPAYGGVAKVTQDVTTALEQQDILPYWIPKLMAVSYHALTRTDLNRAYERGWIDDDAYVNGMYQNGYSDDDAQTLLRFAKSERGVVIRHLPEVKEYADGYLDEEQLRDAMGRQDWNATVIDDIVSEASYQSTLRLQRRMVDAIARQFKACRISLDDAQADAQKNGIPQEVLEYQLGIADLNSSCATRHEYASATCQAYIDGVLNEDEYVQRLQTLKYDQQGIEIQLALCNAKITQAQQKKLLAAQKKAEQEAKQAEKAAEKAQKQAEQQAARLQKLAEASERRRQSRNNKLADAGAKLAAFLTDSSGPPAVLVQGLFSELMGTFNLSQDESAAVIANTAAQAKGLTQAQYTQWALQDASIALNAPWSLCPPAGCAVEV